MSIGFNASASSIVKSLVSKLYYQTCNNFQRNYSTKAQVLATVDTPLDQTKKSKRRKKENPEDHIKDLKVEKICNKQSTDSKLNITNTIITKRPKVNINLYNSLLNNYPENEISLIPTRLLKIRRTLFPATGYLISKSTAKEIKEILEQENLDLNATSIEVCPGIGCWTEQLLELGLKRVTCFEESADLGRHLKSLYPNDSLTVIPRNFLRLRKLQNAEQYDPGTSHLVSDVLEQVKISEKSDNLYVFGVIHTTAFIHFAIKSFLSKTVLYSPFNSWKNVTYFLLISPRPFAIITGTPEVGFDTYLATSVLFQTLFKYEMLKTFPRNSTVPWEKPYESNKPKTKGGHSFVHDRNACHLIRFSVNQENIQKIGEDKLYQFYFFVKNHLFSRNFPVIPLLENWIPNCGPKLIRQGYTIYTRFGELPPEKILELYLDFVSLPQFRSSSFVTAVEKYYHTNREDDIDEQEEDHTEISDSETSKVLLTLPEVEEHKSN